MFGIAFSKLSSVRYTKEEKKNDCFCSDSVCLQTKLTLILEIFTYIINLTDWECKICPLNICVPWQLVWSWYCTLCYMRMVIGKQLHGGIFSYGENRHCVYFFWISLSMVSCTFHGRFVTTKFLVFFFNCKFQDVTKRLHTTKQWAKLDNGISTLLFLLIRVLIQQP